MARQDIFGLLASKYNIVKEMNKIAQLFEQIKVGYNNFNFTQPQQTYTIEQIFEWNCFPKWKQRGPYISCVEMRADLNLPHQFSKDKESIIQGLEYYINILTMLQDKLNISNNINISCPPIYHMLVENIDILLERLNYEKQIFYDEEKVILVPKNPAATAAAEISSKETAFAILKYNHASLKGDLEGKKQLLLSIANEYEPLLKKPIDGFKDYFDKTNALLNNLHLRHNNKTGKDKKQIVAEMPNEELEKWYDELYQLLLFCVLIQDNVKRKAEVDTLLKKLRKG